MTYILSLLILVPLVGAVVAWFVGTSQRLAKLIALGVSLIETTLATLWRCSARKWIGIILRTGAASTARSACCMSFVDQFQRFEERFCQVYGSMAFIDRRICSPKRSSGVKTRP